MRRKIPPLTVKEIAAARALADKIGDRKAADRLGISIEALIRILGGRRIHPGTVALVRLGLDELRA
jgi:hypothetical protein